MGGAKCTARTARRCQTLVVSIFIANQKIKTTQFKNHAVLKTTQFSKSLDFEKVGIFEKSWDFENCVVFEKSWDFEKVGIFEKSWDFENSVYKVKNLKS